MLYKSVLEGVRKLHFDKKSYKGFLRIESTAGQKCACKSTEFASALKIVDENRGDMENF